MNPQPNQDWCLKVENTISGLERNVQDILQGLSNLQTSQSRVPLSVTQSTPPPVMFPASANNEPKIPPPERFEGNPEQCRPFLTQCSLHFELQPSAFPSERAKVAYTISLLSGKAKQWGTSEWENNSDCCDTYFDFSEEMKRVFDPVRPEREAARKLFSIKQGSRPVTDYIINFHALMPSCNWNDEALFDAFYQGLSEDIKDEIAARDPPKTLRALEQLATRIDQRLRERRRERSTPYYQRRVSTVQVSPCTFPQASSPPPECPEEPMQLGRTKLSAEERERRFRNRLCFYCGEKNHRALNCPLKGQAQ